MLSVLLCQEQFVNDGIGASEKQKLFEAALIKLAGGDEPKPAKVLAFFLVGS